MSSKYDYEQEYSDHIDEINEVDMELNDREDLDHQSKHGNHSKLLNIVLCAALITIGGFYVYHAMSPGQTSSEEETEEEIETIDLTDSSNIVTETTESGIIIEKTVIGGHIGTFDRFIDILSTYPAYNEFSIVCLDDHLDLVYCSSSNYRIFTNTWDSLEDRPAGLELYYLEKKNVYIAKYTELSNSNVNIKLYNTGKLYCTIKYEESSYTGEINYADGTVQAFNNKDELINRLERTRYLALVNDQIDFKEEYQSIEKEVKFFPVDDQAIDDLHNENYEKYLM